MVRQIYANLGAKSRANGKTFELTSMVRKKPTITLEKVVCQLEDMMSLRKMILWTWMFLSIQPSNISSYFLFNHNEKTQATRSQSTHLLIILDHVLFEVVNHILVPRGNQNGELNWITIWIMACLTIWIGKSTFQLFFSKTF